MEKKTIAEKTREYVIHAASIQALLPKEDIGFAEAAKRIGASIPSWDMAKKFSAPCL